MLTTSTYHDANETRPTPIVSVIMPAYNAARYIYDAIMSIVSQTLQQWELIIIDDGSTDETLHIVQNIAKTDPRIRVIEQKNSGEAFARASGLAESNGEMIYFLDADDIALPDTLECLARAMFCKPNVVAVYGDHLRIDANGDFIYPQGRVLNRLSRPQGDILADLLKQPLFAIGAALVRKSHLTQQDIIVDTCHLEDWVMWVRLALKGDFAYFGKQPLMYYRYHGSNQTHHQKKMAEHMKAIETVFSMDALHQRFSPRKLQKIYRARMAFSMFALACKALRHQDYTGASKLLKQSLLEAYWWRASVWGMYALARIGWLPEKIRRHLG